nr:helix-turn-helix transcriptional regulator [Nocardiopsis ansamitocini]
MSRRISPTVRRRRLSALLRHLRTESGKTLEVAASALEWSRGRLAHMEGNKWSRPDLGNLKQLLDLYEVTDPAQREAVLTLARQSRERGWWAKFKDVFGESSFVGFEAEAAVVWTYQPLVVPGLLQTRDYAQASAQAALTRPSPEAVERAVAARMARQDVLSADFPPTIWAVIDEGVLRRLPVANGVAEQQLQHLIALSERPDNAITVQVLPFSAGLHPGLSGPFVIMDFPEELDAPMVFLETRTDGLFLEEDDDIAEYRHVFDHLQVTARSQSESIELMKDMLANL